MTEVFIYFFVGALVSVAFFIFTYRIEQQITGRDLLVGGTPVSCMVGSNICTDSCWVTGNF